MSTTQKIPRPQPPSDREWMPPPSYLPTPNRNLDARRPQRRRAIPRRAINRWLEQRYQTESNKQGTLPTPTLNIAQQQQHQQQNFLDFIPKFMNSGTDCWFNAVLQILILLMSLVTNAQNPDGRAPQDPYAFIVYEKLNEFSSSRYT